ncbi:type VI secretion system baseplate subunit TssG [Sodalis sp. dw_96]|uniref:type VI secretion system baseplate subunit TssG n=1 Tax=Sodalis sp. dw_96 TaxID=2719794 RepID=UPI00210441CF|nr:type VI secretion system baseplate subunit TssG [Sodalis sp. dw_96]
MEAMADRMPMVDVYRFCQLLELAVPESQPLGSTANPANDPVRFRPHPGMGFPVSELKAIEDEGEYPERPATVRTTFLGLYGVNSPLPTPYLDDISQQREGHQALEAFLDIFNHRIFTQFYRIWRKYSYPATFTAGGTDAISQCLLGLVGLGIQGTAGHIATPMSRFLALLDVMRLPTRTAEGVVALVALLAPDTVATVTPHCPQKIVMTPPAGLAKNRPVNLSQRAMLGGVGADVNSQLLLTLTTEDPKEAQGWLPGGPLHTDLLVLIRVYLGWRCSVRLQLTLPIICLPAPVLGEKQVQLGLTGVLGLRADAPLTPAMPAAITIGLGRYQGLQQNTVAMECQNVRYRF